MRISSPVETFVFIRIGLILTFSILPSRPISRLADGFPSASRPEPIATSSTICEKSPTLRPSIETILSPSRSPASFAGDSCLFPSTSVISFATKPTVVDSIAALCFIPITQTIAANAAANSRLKNAPAALTMILSAHDALGSFSVSPPLPPSSAPMSASWGRATYPPNGRSEIMYSQPSLPFAEKSLGPKPIEKRSIFSPRMRAARKCPSSWTKIEPPKNSITRANAQVFEKMSANSPMLNKRCCRFARLCPRFGVRGENVAEFGGVYCRRGFERLFNHLRNFYPRQFSRDEIFNRDFVRRVENRSSPCRPRGAQQTRV